MQARRQFALPTLLLPIVLLCVLPQGCSDKKTPPKQSPGALSETPNGISLLLDGEVEQLRKTFAEIAAQNAAKVCERPLLRAGEALEGPADADMLSFFASEGPLADCFTKVAAVEALLPNGEKLTALVRDQEGRALALGELSGIGDDALASIDSILKACSEIDAALARAVSHQDACSPALPGRHGIDTLLPLSHLSKAALLRSRKLAEAGNVLGAVRLLLDTIRFGQDISRGGTSLIEPMLAFHLLENIAPELDSLLDLLSLPELEAIEDELTILEDSHPKRFSYFQGERDSQGIYTVWPSLEERDWQPPGGYALGQSGPVDSSVDKSMDPLSSTVLVWVVFDRLATKQQELCPEDGPLLACVEASKAFQDSASSITGPDMPTLLKAAIDSEKAGRMELREQILKILESVAVVSYSKYFVRMEVMQMTLRAQKHKVRSRLAALRKKPCPAPLDSDLRVALAGDETLVLAPQWLIDIAGSEAESAPYTKPLARIRCM